MDVRGCGLITVSVGVSVWLGHSRVGFTGNNDDNVLQPPVLVHMGHNVGSDF